MSGNPTEAGSRLFEIICRHKDAKSSNLNQLFDSYGLSTLEAKVPVVKDTVASRLEHASQEQQKYAAMALQSESAAMAVEGRRPRTANKQLKVIEINGESILATGESRERSPVDRDELDKDIETYAQERDRQKALRLAGMLKGDNIALQMERKLNISSQTKPLLNSARMDTSTMTVPKSYKDKKKFEDIDEQEMDADLEAYMKEASRRRAQKSKLAEATDRMATMASMEEFEEDNMGF